jgi:23S rRNA (uracil1939-C5)-methyltransferase
MRDLPIVNEIVIDKWIYGGDGLARTEAGVVMVPFVLPGEVVRVSAPQKSRAKLESVVLPAPERVPPACPVYMHCGGCHYQHAAYEFQVARKVEILREQLKRVGKIEYAGEIDVIRGPALSYRNRAQFHVADGRIGFREAGSHKLVALEGDCPTASPKLNQTLRLLRERLFDPQFPRFVKTLEVFTNEQDVQINAVETDKPVARRFYDWMGSSVSLDYQTSVGLFRVSPKSFFQVNRFLISELVEAAIGGANGESALDLYAGAGLFALPLSKQFAKVTAVEAVSAAAHDLRFNAERAGAAIESEYARVEEFLAQLEQRPDFIVADPPRAGLGPAVVEHLNRIAAPQLSIVSCDPATLARDLAAMPDYRIESLTMIDLFPQTFHLETVARLARAV